MFSAKFEQIIARHRGRKFKESKEIFPREFRGISKKKSRLQKT